MRARAVRVAMVAAETSGDSLGAGLIEAIRARRPGSFFTGVGGPKMAAAGCEILFDMERIGVIGLDGLLKKLPGIFRIRRNLLARFCNEKPDVFIGVDAPDFNLSLARNLKRRGVTCVHYVSPTVWAWRGYRIRKIRASVDHMLALFPFEAEFCRKNDVPVTCVGHPIADQISAPNRERARAALQLDGAPLIALLPGSRRGEMRRHAKLFLHAARKILDAHAHAKFVLPFANRAVRDEYARATRGMHAENFPLRTLEGGARRALEACDLAVLASGTASLEAALLQRAHIVVYKLPAVSYWLMRQLVQVEHFCMPNQLLPSPLVPELIQERATPANIAQAACALLADSPRARNLERAFATMHAELKLGANARAADAVLALCN